MDDHSNSASQMLRPSQNDGQTPRFKQLPRKPYRIWAGQGGGRGCALCGKPVERDEVEYELEFDGERSAGEEYYVHERCFAAWKSPGPDVTAEKIADSGGRPETFLTASHRLGNLTVRDDRVRGSQQTQ